MPQASKAQHKSTLDEMLRLIDATLNALPPKNTTAKRDVALRRWAMVLGTLLLNVGRSVSRLLETDDIVGIVILGRSTYEYRLKTEFFFKNGQNRRIAFDQFRSVVAAYTAAMSRLPVMTSTVEQKLKAAKDYWVSVGGSDDQYAGERGVKAMALDVASASEILTDEKGDRYTHMLATSYGIPSWFAHGSAPLIAEFFPKWNIDDDWTFSQTPLNHTDVLPTIRGIIADLYVYLFTIRKYYDFGLYELS